MKLFKTILDDCQHLLFLDFEGTQFSHEVIAIGAVLVDCDQNYIPVGEPSTFKCYVKATSNIGSVIETMTGIHQQVLDEQGLSFSQAMTDLNNFLGQRSTKLKVLTYGNQDKHMLLCSVKASKEKNPFLKSFVNYLCHNNVDIGAFFSRYIRGKKNELISLIHLRDFLNVPPSGPSHDPLVDSLDLFHIYQVFATDKKILKDSYKKLLKSSNIVPQPLKVIINDLIDGKSVTSDDLDRVLDIYFE